MQRAEMHFSAYDKHSINISYYEEYERENFEIVSVPILNLCWVFNYSKNKGKLFYNSVQKGDVLLFINVLFVPKVCVMLHQQNISHFIIHFNIFKR